MEENTGMWFPAKDSHIIMWMKDTYIPLDMLFFNHDMKIVYIHTAKPQDLTPIFVKDPVAGVIELSGGICKKLGIQTGDTVLFDKQ